MDQSFADAMRRALEQTRKGDPAGATRTIQGVLGLTPAPGGDAAPTPGGAVIEGTARRVSPGAAPKADRGARVAAPDASGGDISVQPEGGAAPGGPRPFGLRGRLGEVVARLREGVGRLPLPGGLPGGAAADPEHPEGGRWQRLHWASAEGARDYRLYLPANPAPPSGLVLLLHGCTQNPEDFVTGTRMIAEAERAGLILLVPEQGRGDNPQLCWNWFRPGDQQGGEAALLAALASCVAREHGVPEGRVFAAGLSAGGAMAAILGAAHPEVFAAVGVHSGLPAGAAQDMAGAFAAMKGARGAARPIRARTIAFHGSADATVAPANGEAVLAAARAGLRGATETAAHGLTGRPWRVTRLGDAEGRAMAEHWVVDGLGHAWSGGDPRGSYADPKGPDASAEMVRFFLS